MTATTEREFGTAVDPAEPEAQTEFEIRPRRWIKRVLPRTMFGRSLLIVVIPLVLLQAIATWIFYDRHWAAVSWRLSTGVAGDIAVLIEAIQLAGSDAEIARLLDIELGAVKMRLQRARGHLKELLSAYAPGGKEIV